MACCVAACHEDLTAALQADSAKYCMSHAQEMMPDVVIIFILQVLCTKLPAQLAKLACRRKGYCMLCSVVLCFLKLMHGMLGLSCRCPSHVQVIHVIEATACHSELSRASA